MEPFCIQIYIVCHLRYCTVLFIPFVFSYIHFCHNQYVVAHRSLSIYQPFILDCLKEYCLIISVMLVFEKILKAYKADLSIKVIIMKICSKPSICIRTLEKKPNACICICIPRFLVYLCCLKIDFAAVSLVLVLFLCIILFIYMGLYGILGIYIY